MVWKCAASVQYTLHLMTLSSDEPAVVKQSFSCSSTSSAWRSIGKRLISPVAGSYGGMFDTKTRSPHRTAMLTGTFAGFGIGGQRLDANGLFIHGGSSFRFARACLTRRNAGSKTVLCRFPLVRRVPNRRCLLMGPRGR